MEETRFQKIEKLKKQERWGSTPSIILGVAFVAVAALLLVTVFVPPLAVPLVGGVLSLVSPPVAVIGAVICGYLGFIKIPAFSRDNARQKLEQLGYSGQQSYNSYGNEDSRENKKNNKVHNEPGNEKSVEAGEKATMQKKEVKDEARLGTKRKETEHPLVAKVKAVEQNNKKGNTFNK